MRHAARSLLLALLGILGCAAWSVAQDNPILRERLEQKIVEELAKHNSEETAWYNEKSIDKQKWTEGKILGRPIRLASWTEQSKTWVWLEEPRQNVSIDLTRLTIREGRLEFALAARAKARFKAWGRIPKLGQAAVGGVVVVMAHIEGSAVIGPGELSDSKITKFNLDLDELKFNNKAARAFDDLIENALNDYVDDKSEKLRHSAEKTINRVHF